MGFGWRCADTEPYLGRLIRNAGQGKGGAGAVGQNQPLVQIVQSRMFRRSAFPGKTAAYRPQFPGAKSPEAVGNTVFHQGLEEKFDAPLPRQFPGTGPVYFKGPVEPHLLNGNILPGIFNFFFQAHKTFPVYQGVTQQTGEKIKHPAGIVGNAGKPDRFPENIFKGIKKKMGVKLGLE